MRRSEKPEFRKRRNWNDVACSNNYLAHVATWRVNDPMTTLTPPTTIYITPLLILSNDPRLRPPAWNNPRDGLIRGGGSPSPPFIHGLPFFSLLYPTRESRLPDTQSSSRKLRRPTTWFLVLDTDRSFIGN